MNVMIGGSAIRNYKKEVIKKALSNWRGLFAYTMKA